MTGIGKGMATALAVNGAKVSYPRRLDVTPCSSSCRQVIICGRRVEQVDDAAKEINALARQSGNGGHVIAFQADVGTKQGVVEFYDKCDKVVDKVSREFLSLLPLIILKI